MRWFKSRSTGRRRDAAGVRVEVAACLSGTVVLSGIQGLAPALPALQAALGLSTSAVSLITIVYILPGIFSAVGAGILAQRVGVRAVLAGSLAIYGLAALAILCDPTWMTVLVARVFQGAAFGAALPLSTSILADALTGQRMVAAQSRRVVAMAAAEAVLPLVGGLLVSIVWFATFATQVLALPFAVLTWVLLRHEVFRAPRSPATGSRRPLALRGGMLGSSSRGPGFVAVLSPGFLRFFLKLTLFTYFPILAAERYGASAGTIGALLALTSVAAVGAASFLPVATRRLSVTVMLGAALVLAGAGTAGLAVAPTILVATASMVVLGWGDGTLSAVNNVLVTVAAPHGQRSAFVGLAYSIRNGGKLAAPVAVAGAVAVMPLAGVFALVGLIGLLCGALAWPVDRRLRWLEHADPSHEVAEP